MGNQIPFLHSLRTKRHQILLTAMSPRCQDEVPAVPVIPPHGPEWAALKGMCWGMLGISLSLGIYDIELKIQLDINSTFADIWYMIYDIWYMIKLIQYNSDIFRYCGYRIGCNNATWIQLVYNQWPFQESIYWKYLVVRYVRSMSGLYKGIYLQPSNHKRHSQAQTKTFLFAPPCA